jgi:hypothetical protein
VQVFLSVHKAAPYAQDSLALFITIWLKVLHLVCANAATIFLALMAASYNLTSIKTWSVGLF